MNVKDEISIDFETYCSVMLSHSPAFIMLPIQYQKVMFDSYIYNSKLKMPDITLSLLTSKN